jgi:hypothetical protein
MSSDGWEAKPCPKKECGKKAGDEFAVDGGAAEAPKEGIPLELVAVVEEVAKDGTPLELVVEAAAKDGTPLVADVVDKTAKDGTPLLIEAVAVVGGSDTDTASSSSSSSSFPSKSSSRAVL